MLESFNMGNNVTVVTFELVCSLRESKLYVVEKQISYDSLIFFTFLFLLISFIWLFSFYYHNS